MATYAIGDLQGCADEFFALLETLCFGGGDRLWLLGDLVNRGPRSLPTLRRVYELRRQVQVVLGNHDLHLLAVAFGGHTANRGDTFEEILAAPDADVLLHWLRSQPLMVHDRELGYAMAHAGILPSWNLSQALARAQEVEVVLAGPGHTEFLREMYGNEPARWRADLKGMARQRFITNAFTRMRLLRADGALDFRHKGSLASAPSGLRPWFEDWDGAALEGQKLLFGHWAALEGETGRDDILALDTGCVWGRTLTAMCLESGELSAVPAVAAHG